MVPSFEPGKRLKRHSPRIRGDGPTRVRHPVFHQQFSPYSRGWSASSRAFPLSSFILPVFAGMVPHSHRPPQQVSYSPRIRGDGPEWGVMVHGHDPILPVFAGMVPGPVRWLFAHSDSPRIRGDGPPSRSLNRGMTSFSPYSRGWSQKTEPP